MSLSEHEDPTPMRMSGETGIVLQHRAKKPSTWGEEEKCERGLKRINEGLLSYQKQVERKQKSLL